MSSSASDIKVSRIGMRYDPPALFIEYIDPSALEPKIHEVSIFHNHLRDATALTEFLQNTQHCYCGCDIFDKNRLKNMIEQLLQSKDDFVEKKKVNKTKKEMSVIFDKNKIDPSSKDFIYDKRIDFSNEEKNNQLSDNSWDDANDDIANDDIANDEIDSDDQLLAQLIASS